jgi:hypothetical protein
MKWCLVAFISAAWITFSLAGCAEDNTTDAGVRIPFSVVETGQFSGLRSERLEVIRIASEFAELWQTHASGFSPAPIQPEVDFDREMVIAVFLGERPTGGFAITVTEATERADSLLVTVRITLPGTNCAVPQAFSQPHQLVTVPQSEQLVAFFTEVERVDCPQ